MSQASQSIDIYLEVGQKRTFAGAVDWPGWCRSGRDAEAAQQALLDAASRYARILHAAKIKFSAPTTLDTFKVVEQLEGDSTRGIVNRTLEFVKLTR